MGMTPYLHFGNGDYLVFQAWIPSSRGAIAAASIGFFLFSVLERCLAAYRRTQELRWRAKTIALCDTDKEATVDSAVKARKRLIPPFKLSEDIPRGIVQSIQSTFVYAMMLAVMTFNGAYILSIILGLGTGEFLVGRIGRK